MNIERDELQKIAQQLDYFMRDYGNSKALEIAAEAIADELEERDYTITRVRVIQEWYVDVKHKRNAEEHLVREVAEEWTQWMDTGEFDTDIVETDIADVTHDTEVDS
jgi:predicted nucleic acid-binding protein